MHVQDDVFSFIGYCILHFIQKNINVQKLIIFQQFQFLTQTLRGRLEIVLEFDGRKPNMSAAIKYK